MARKVTFLITALLILMAYAPEAAAQKFISRDGFPEALKQVQKDVLDSAGNVSKAGMTSPELMAVGTISGQLPNVPLALEFDLKTGESTVWVYVFKSADDNSDVRAIGVVKLILFFMAQEISLADLGGLPIEPDAKIDLDKWKIDSDGFVKKLWENGTFTDYLDVYPNTKLEMLGLGVNFANPLDPNAATWGGVFSDGDSPRLTCITNAETGETICFDLPAGVPDETIQNIEISPNPFSQFATINYELTNSGNVELKVYDMLGNEVAELVNDYLDAGIHSSVFNAAGHNEGLYYYIIRIGENIEGGKLMLVR